MDESANKGLESKGSDDAEIRKSSIRRISVEGYDTSLRRADVDTALRKHLASCGNIIHVYVPIIYESGIICRYSFVYVSEEDEEKVLRLDGSDMGGERLQIKAYPFHEHHLDEDLAPMKEAKGWPQLTMMVTGFDTSLPYDVIMTELEEYFSAVGSFVIRNVTTGVIRSTAEVYARGHEGVDKALERSGRCVGGLSFVVSRVLPPSKLNKCGYTHPLNFTRLTKEQIEDPNLYFIYEGNQKKSDTREGNQKKKKKSKTREGKQKKSKTREGKQKKSKTREGNQKRKSETRDENQKKKGVEISL